jgi:hypothetical protein
MTCIVPTRRAVLDLATAQRAIDPIAQQVQRAVAAAQFELDVGVAFEERVQRRDQQPARHRRGHVHPQPPARVGLARREGFLGVTQVFQDANAALVIRGAVGGDRDAAGGSVQQAHLQVRLQLGHAGGQGGLGGAQQFGRPGETTGVDHAHKGPHGLDRVHCLGS